MKSHRSTLFDKIWSAHRVDASSSQKGVPDTLYGDLHLLHEVTSPQAFSALHEREISVRRPLQCLATMDHSTPTTPPRPDGAITSRAVVLEIDNIDTDQIIPGRFLKTTESCGLGQYLFADWRCDAEGQRRSDFPLNQAQFSDAQILVAGDNFGCGSSREHAVWALADSGFRVVVSTGKVHCPLLISLLICPLGFAQE